ncbi:MAG: hypothetical protein EXR81_05850 [Gammaproteobacteria bacterium]|nr:hypothetical protein [Gammaproteobacteria bacterium]
MLKFWQGNKILFAFVVLLFSITATVQAQDIVCTPASFVATDNMATPFSFTCINNSNDTFSDFKIQSVQTTPGLTVADLKLSGSGCSTHSAYIGYYSFAAHKPCSISGTAYTASASLYAMDFNLYYGGRLQQGIFCGNNLTSTSCLGTVSHPGTPNSLIFIDITPDATIVPLDVKVQYKAIGTYDDGATVDLTRSATWSSSDAAVASIESNTGYAQTIAVGTTTITATYQGISSATATLIVTNATLSSLIITPPTSKIFTGTAEQFNALGVYSDGSTAELTASVAWTSSEPKVASINIGDGLATAQGIDGTTSITASLTRTDESDNQHSVESNAATLKVTTVPLTSILLAPANTTTIPALPAGQTVQYTATGTYADGDTSDITNAVTWSTTNSNVARISKIGLAIESGVGSTRIAASSGSISSKVAPLNVSAVNILASIVVTPASPPPLPLGRQAQQFVATGTYTDGSQYDISKLATWAASDPTKAIISNSGLAVSQAIGSTNVTASSGGKTSTPVALTIADAQLVSLNVSPESNTIYTGTTQQFKALGVYADGTTADLTQSVIWTSSAPTIASINIHNGLATAKTSTGSTNITASAQGINSNLTVLNVTKAVLTSILITPSSVQVPGGESAQYKATGIYADGSTGDATHSVTWASSNIAVATIVASTGVAKAISNSGTANISASSGSIASNSVPFTAISATLQSLAITPVGPLTLKVGVSQQFTATATYSDASTRDVTAEATWTSTDPTKAAISTTGLASGVASGAANISAKYNVQNSNVTVINVIPKTITSIAVTPATATISFGGYLSVVGTQQYTATATYSDNTTANITTQATWVSSNTGTATIAATGLATAVAVASPPTTTTITATLNSTTSPPVTSLRTVPPSWTKVIATPTTAIAMGGNWIYAAGYSGGQNAYGIYYYDTTLASPTVAFKHTIAPVAGIYANAQGVYAAVNYNSPTVPNQVIKSTDGGVTWTPAQMDQGATPNAIFADNAGSTYYVGTSKGLAKSSQSGVSTTWSYPYGTNAVGAFAGTYNPNKSLYTYYVSIGVSLYRYFLPNTSAPNLFYTGTAAFNSIGSNLDGSVIALSSPSVSGSAWLSVNGTAGSATFQMVSPLGSSVVNSVFVSPTGKTVIFATNKGIYLSRNATSGTKATWTVLAPWTPVNSVYLQQDRVIYAATPSGLLVYK